MKVCPNCGKQYPDDANFCPVDAGRLAASEQTAQPQTSTKAATPVAADSGVRLLGGRFELGEHIGGGLTGEVHRAKDTKTGAACTVKLVDESVFPSSLLMQRTERELKQLTRVDNVGVARILGHGRDKQTLWIATELFDGRSLHDLVFDEGPMQAPRASQLIIEVAKALTAAAKVGVTHRDLAPKNILVDKDGVAKVINFGVATPEVNGVAGVPEFVAPEMIRGKSVDQRANIYSLGAMFYFLLTGKPPYSGEPTAVHDQHLAGELTPPSEVVEGIPDLVDALVIKALEQQSRHRFMTIRQLLTDLEALADGNFDSASPAVTQRLARAGGKTSRKKALSQTRLGFSSSSTPSITLPGKDDAAKPGAKADAKADAKPDAKADAKPDANADAKPEDAKRADVEARRARMEAEKAADKAISPATTLPLNLGKVPVEDKSAPADAASKAPEVKPAPEDKPAPGAAAAAAVAVAADSVPAAPSIPAEVKHAEPSEAAKRRAAERAKRRRQQGDKNKFRETLWFKKGQLDAEAASKAETAQKGGAPAIDKADMMPMEDRYEDDGSLTRGDREKFSLKTGGTQTMAAFDDKPAPATATSVSDEELIQEMKSGRGKIIVFLIIGLLLVVGIIVFAATSGGHGSSDEEDKPKKPKITLPPEPPPPVVTPDAGVTVDAAPAPAPPKPAAKKKSKKKKKKKR